MSFTSPSEESKAKIETCKKTDIENQPPTYSEVLEITIENPPPNYSEVAQITVEDNENVTLENVPRVTNQELLGMANPPPKYSEAPQN